MPRNDQVTRQWHVPLCLDGTRGLTLDELIASLTPDYPRGPQSSA